MGGKTPDGAILGRRTSIGVVGDHFPEISSIEWHAAWIVARSRPNVSDQGRRVGCPKIEIVSCRHLASGSPDQRSGRIDLHRAVGWAGHHRGIGRQSIHRRGPDVSRAAGRIINVGQGQFSHVRRPGAGTDPVRSGQVLPVGGRGRRLPAQADLYRSAVGVFSDGTVDHQDLIRRLLQADLETKNVPVASGVGDLVIFPLSHEFPVGRCPHSLDSQSGIGLGLQVTGKSRDAAHQLGRREIGGGKKRGCAAGGGDDHRRRKRGLAKCDPAVGIDPYAVEDIPGIGKIETDGKTRACGHISSRRIRRIQEILVVGAVIAQRGSAGDLRVGPRNVAPVVIAHLVLGVANQRKCSDQCCKD